MAYIRAKDRIGTTVNGFYIEDVKRENKRTYAYVICPYCKKKRWVRMEYVTDGINVSCGCYNKEHNLKKPKDISNKICGRLKAIKPTEKRDKFNGSVIWECECECGNIAYVSASDLIREKIKSCGCLEQDSRIKNGVKVSEYVKANSCVDNTSVIAIKSNKIFKNNTSGIRGVCWSDKEQKWVAQIDFKGKHYRLGSFKKKEDAAKARKTAEKELFGNFLEWYASEYPQKWEMLNKNKTEKKNC